MTKRSTLSTAADSLLDLARTEKQVSFKDAAKKLNVSARTIESWAEILQEQKGISIRYKLMTPYIVLADGVKDPGRTEVEDKKLQIDEAVRHSRESMHKLMANAEKDSEKSLDPRDLVKKMEETESIRQIRSLLNTFSQSLEKGDLSSLDQTVKDSFALLKKSVSVLLDDRDLRPQRKVEVSDAIKLIEQKISSASDMVKSQKFDDASRLYFEVKAEMAELSERVHRNLQEQKDLKVSYESIKELFLKTHQLLNLGKVAEAADTYEEAERIIKGLSGKIRREKSEMQEDIIKLNQDFTTITAQVRKEKLDELTKLIKDFCSKANDSLKKKDLVSAKQYYEEIERYFRQIPPGFSNEKEKLKKQALRLFGRVVLEEQRQTRSKFDFFYNKIMEILKSSKKPGVTIEEYLGMYREMVALFDKLPNGFMREKFEVQKEIMLFYNFLIQEFEVRSDNYLRVGISQISELLATMRSQVDSGDLVGAAGTYTKVSAVFKNLPRGFLDQKTKIQKSILDVYEALIDKKNKLERPRRKDSKNISDIEKLLKELEEVIVARNYPQAYLLYREIKNVYNGMDSNSSERRMIADKILAAYKKIVLLRSLQEEHSMELPPAIHVDSRKEVKDMIEDLRRRYKPRVGMPGMKGGARQIERKG